MSERHEHDRALDWAALERFATVMSSGLGYAAIVPAEFMWMGASRFADGRIIHHYKHIDSRRYLHLDEAGHAYRYRRSEDRSEYLAHESPIEAVVWVMDPAVEVSAFDLGH